jgi:hypothetical protein
MCTLRDCLRRNVGLSAVLTAFGLIACAPPSATAQVFVPPKGDGAVAILYQNQFVEQHSLFDGSRIDRGATRTHVIAVDLMYGLTDRLAVNVSLPYIASVYLGEAPHQAAQFGRDSAIDVGGYHGTFQDFRVDVRYNATRSGVVVTPYVSAVMPSHNYDYFGHGAAGRRMAEIQMGVYVGQTLERLVPGAFVQARYAFGVPQGVAGERNYRSVMEGEVGYFVRPTLRIFAVATGQVSHAGIRFVAPDFFNYLNADGKIHHDRVSRINSVNIGAGAQLSLTPSIDVFGSIVHTKSMTNGHVLKYAITAGLSWSFHHGPQRASTAASQRDALVKCLCQKGQ